MKYVVVEGFELYTDKTWKFKPGDFICLYKSKIFNSRIISLGEVKTYDDFAYPIGTNTYKYIRARCRPLTTIEMMIKDIIE